VSAQGSPQSPAPQRDRSIVVAIIGLIGAVAAAVISGFFSYRAGQDASDKTENLGPPSVHVTSAKWVDDKEQPGRYAIDGESKNLRQGQLIWTYNQPIQPGGKKGPLYPDPGPCPVGPDGDWTCDAGFAGEAKARGQRFLLWAMVVDERQGYAAIKTMLGQGNPGRSYISSDDVPHVDGTQTQDSFSVARPD
jgi:hypothetical protein